MAFLRSCSPPSIFLVSPASTTVDELVEPAREILQHGLPAFGPLDEHGEILGARAQRLAEVAILLEPAAPLEQLLRARLVLPEVRIGDALFYGCELFRGMCGVKDSSADRRRGAQGPDICEAVRRGLYSHKAFRIADCGLVICTIGDSTIWIADLLGRCSHSSLSDPPRARSAAAVRASESQATRSPIRL